MSHPDADVSRQKQLGAYYTPEPVADILAAWAVRAPSDRVLDPAFGGRVLLRAADRRLQALRAGSAARRRQLYGCELDLETYRVAARERWLLDANLVRSDFLALTPPAPLPACEVLIGNPPYVRSHHSDRDALAQAAARAGLKTTAMASAWVAFVAHGIQFVRPGGRMALVLPAELIHVQYAQGVLEHVCERFSRVTLVLAEGRLFEGAQQEVVLLLAEGAGGRCPNAQVVPVSDLLTTDPSAFLQRLSHEATEPISLASGPDTGGGHEKALSRLLPAKTRDLLNALQGDERVQPLGQMASVAVGALTGANDFFLLDDATAAREGIAPEMLRATVSRAAHIPGAVLRPTDMARLRGSGAPVLLLAIPANSSAAQLDAVRATLERGVELGLPDRYKISKRSEWWTVPIPGGGPADLLLTYCADAHPRLVLNAAAALNTNTLHGVRVTAATDPLDLAGAWPNSLTLLSCELVGRPFGGGVLKLEPSAARAVLIPPIEGAAQLLDDVDDLIRRGQLDHALKKTDRLVLQDALGLSDADANLLRGAANQLRTRRHQPPA